MNEKLKIEKENIIKEKILEINNIGFVDKFKYLLNKKVNFKLQIKNYLNHIFSFNNYDNNDLDFWKQNANIFLIVRFGFMSRISLKKSFHNRYFYLRIIELGVHAIYLDFFTLYHSTNFNYKNQILFKVEEYYNENKDNMIN